MNEALTELEPLILAHPATGIDRDWTRAFVDARTTELVDNGAVSLILLPTGSQLAPVAIGAVFVQPAICATAAQWLAALEADGWIVASAAPRSAVYLAGMDADVIRANRCLPIPGIAGLVLSERLAVMPTAQGVVTVHFQGASTKSASDMSDSLIMEAVNSAGWKKD